MNKDKDITQTTEQTSNITRPCDHRYRFILKRLLAITAASLIAASWLTACGSAGSTGNTGINVDNRLKQDTVAGADIASGSNTDSASASAIGSASERNPQANDSGSGSESVLVYGSNDYTRINPAMDEHGEISKLIFDGLMRNDSDNKVVPGLASSYDYDEDSYTYTFHLREGIKWHDGEPLTASDVKFTIDAIRDPANLSENAPDFEDIEEIELIDEHTISFRLSAPNAAFTQYMTMAILPEHCLEGEDMQESDFFRAPIGTGAYSLESWDAGQSIVLTKNEDYYRGAANIDKLIFKIVPDDNAQAIQLKSGEIDLALLDAKNAANFEDAAGYTVYDMLTADYRGILFNYANEYWQENKDLIPAVCYAIDRQAIVDAVLLGHGMAAYGPLQRNEYNDENAPHYYYDPDRAKAILEAAGCTLNKDGYYERNGEEIGFTINVMSGEQDRLDIALAAAQQLREIGISCKVDIPAVMDWSGQAAAIIGWGSPFDADDHTYKVFGTGNAANYSAYSDARVDRFLKAARESFDKAERKNNYDAFQEALYDNPPYAFICYLNAEYVVSDRIHGIKPDMVLGHHGVGIFNNITEWTID